MTSTKTIATHNPFVIPMRVKEKVFQAHCNIGAEGIVTVYTAETLEKPPVDKLLAVFIADFEELEFRAATDAPPSLDDMEDKMGTLMEALQKYYIEYSMAERNLCAQLN